jgi:hypothetical protein
VPDVDLGVGDLESQGREALEGGGEGGPLRRGADDEVALEADAVDRGAGVEEDLRGFDDAVCLGAVVLEVVVVEVPVVVSLSKELYSGNIWGLLTA